MSGPSGVPRADILALIAEGHSDRYIGRTLHTNPKRVGQIRRELDLPQYEPTRLTLEQQWAVRIRPLANGHTQWRGALRAGTPNLVHDGHNHSARRVGFVIAHGRQPVGRVLPGCGMSWCVAGAHATDAQIRRADHLYTAIFERSAA